MNVNQTCTCTLPTLQQVALSLSNNSSSHQRDEAGDVDLQHVLTNSDLLHLSATSLGQLSNLELLSTTPSNLSNPYHLSKWTVDN